MTSYLFFAKRSQLAVVSLLLLAGGVSAGRPPARRKGPSPSKPTAPNVTTIVNVLVQQMNTHCDTTAVLSVTMTPYHNEKGVEVWDDTSRVLLCGDIFDVLTFELQMLVQDGVIIAFTLAIERGLLKQEPHLGATIVVQTTAGPGVSRAEELTAAVAEYQKTLKAMLQEACLVHNTRHEVSPGHKVPRLVVKSIPWTDNGGTKNHHGYDMKDKHKPWYRFSSGGLSDEYLKAADALYQVQAMKCHYSSKKVDKSPWADKTQLKWDCGNYHPLSKWCLANWNLQLIAKQMSLAIVMALSFTTESYMIDEMIITGKNGGVPLDPIRSDALFVLETALPGDLPFGPELVALVETVMYGAARNHSRLNGVVGPNGIVMPSTYEIVNGFGAGLNTLDSLQTVCSQMAEEAPLRVTDAPVACVSERGGRFWVSDRLSFPHSSEARDMFTAAGLIGQACLATDQVPNMCGHLCAGAANMLHELGNNFDQLGCDAVAALNTPVFALTSNLLLNIPGNVATQLYSEEILALAARLQAAPDGVSPGNDDVGWMHSPVPLNYFKSFFARTVVEKRYHGTVHVMAVNTDAQYSIHTAVSGTHWFLCAWFIEPEPED